MTMTPEQTLAEWERHRSPRIKVSEFTIRHPEGRDDVVFRGEGDDDFVDAHRGQDDGRLLIRIGVDGEGFTIVSADSNGTATLTLVRAGIAALTEIKANLERMAPREASRGLCLDHGDWGRCKASEGHTGPHEHPTEADWRRLSGIPGAEVSR